jgi:hypothetical protein
VILTVGVPRTVFVGIGLTGIGWAGCFVLTQVVIADFFAGPNLGKFSGAFILFEGISAGSGLSLRSARVLSGCFRVELQSCRAGDPGQPHLSARISDAAIMR